MKHNTKINFEGWTPFDYAFYSSFYRAIRQISSGFCEIDVDKVFLPVIKFITNSEHVRQTNVYATSKNFEEIFEIVHTKHIPKRANESSPEFVDKDENIPFLKYENAYAEL